jgi:hypothetical protein
MRKKKVNSPHEELVMDIRNQGVTDLLETILKIDDKNYMDFINDAIDILPIGFFIQPASSSGKYHPDYAAGLGGLVKHTKAACLYAEILFPIYRFKASTKNSIRCALVLHDIAKPDKNHPILAKLILEPLRNKYGKIFDEVIPLIESHMGQWDKYGKLPTPITEAQKFVHLCDYLASRKELNIPIR